MSEMNRFSSTAERFRESMRARTASFISKLGLVGRAKGMSARSDDFEARGTIDPSEFFSVPEGAVPAVIEGDTWTKQAASVAIPEQDIDTEFQEMVSTQTKVEALTRKPLSLPPLITDKAPASERGVAQQDIFSVDTNVPEAGSVLGTYGWESMDPIDVEYRALCGSVVMAALAEPSPYTSK